MDVQTAQKQVESMRQVILSEARTKCQEIKQKGEEDFQAEVQKTISEHKEKIRQSFEKRTKSIETQFAIAKSLAINKQRLEKIKARQEVMGSISGDAKDKLKEKMGNQEQSKAFITKLIVQGLLMLLESDVEVRCKESDVKLTEACLQPAMAEYQKIIKAQTGAAKSVKLTVSKSQYVPSDSIGGVVLSCQDGKISIDNTIDLRLSLVMEQDKPAIRSQLFPGK